MLGGRRIHLVLHLKHDREVLDSIYTVSEDEVPLCPTRSIIILLEVSSRHHGAKHLAKEVGTVCL